MAETSREAEAESGAAAAEAAQERKLPSPAATSQQCGICLDTAVSTVGNCDDCGFVSCDSCLATYARLKVESGEVSTEQLKCPSCPRHFTDAELAQLLEPAVLEKCARFRADLLVVNDPTARFCPAAGCAAVVRVSTSRRRRTKCDDCGLVSCFRCGQKHHPFHSCASVRDRDFSSWAKSKKTGGSKQYTGVKSCPGCGFQIEKTGGCPHMNCKRCRCSFCWRCRGPWTSNHTDSLYGCPGGHAIYGDTRLSRACGKTLITVLGIPLAGAAAALALAGIGAAAAIALPCSLVYVPLKLYDDRRRRRRAFNDAGSVLARTYRTQVVLARGLHVHVTCKTSQEASLFIAAFRRAQPRGRLENPNRYLAYLSAGLLIVTSGAGLTAPGLTTAPAAADRAHAQTAFEFPPQPWSKPECGVLPQVAAAVVLAAANTCGVQLAALDAQSTHDYDASMGARARDLDVNRV